MLRNRRGATSLRWLRALLDADVQVHGQVVVCPGVNDGEVLEDTMVGIADRFPELATVAVVPLGISRYGRKDACAPHTVAEAGATIDTIEAWQQRFLDILGRRMVYAADEYYLLARRPFPDGVVYEGFPLHEDGIGMARSFEREFAGEVATPIGPRAGFFNWVDGAPAEGYRAPRGQITLRPRRSAPVAILTGSYGASVLAPHAGRPRRRPGGRGREPVLRRQHRRDRADGGGGPPAGPGRPARRSSVPAARRLPVRGGCFLDGTTPEDLPRPVEVVATDGSFLRAALAPAAA